MYIHNYYTCTLDYSAYHNDMVGRVFVIHSDAHCEEGRASQELLQQEEWIIDVPA